ncbi:hypothetical protein AAMO2058_001523000 [Amorphochlora amoebiformis]
MAAPFPELRGFATEEENPEFELSFSGQPLEPSVPPPATAALGSLSQIKTSRSHGKASGRRKLESYGRMLWANSESKKLIIFVGVSGGYSSLQMLYAAYAQSIETMSISLHNYFHCVVLISSLLAMAKSAENKGNGYSYGLDRFNVLAAFTNDLFGIFLFYQYSRLRMAEIKIYGTHLEAQRVNLHSVFLHVMADITRTLGEIFCVVVQRWRDWDSLPAIVSFAVAIRIIASVLPLIRGTGGIILQAAPSPLLRGVQKSMEEILSSEGVLGCTKQNFWVFSPGVTVGTIHLRVSRGADPQAVLRHADTLLRKYVTHMTIEIDQESKSSDHTHGDKHKHREFNGMKTITNSSKHEAHGHNGNVNGHTCTQSHNHSHASHRHAGHGHSCRGQHD